MKESWLYEEEVIKATNTLWWSNSGKHLAWLKTNESLVEEYFFPWYEESSQYPLKHTLRYPKPGGNNPLVDLMFRNIATGKNVICPKFSSEDFYITNVVWDDSEMLLLKWTNRLQNYEHIMKIDSDTCISTEIFSHIDNAWIETESATPLEGTGYFVDLRPNGDFMQLVLHDSKTGYLKAWLTAHQFPVTSFVGFDNESGFIFYQAAPTPISRQMFKVSVHGGEPAQLTNEKDGTWWSASCFDNHCTWILLTNGGPSIPTQTVVKSTFDVSYDFNTNTEFKSLLAVYDVPVMKYSTVPSADKSVDLNMFTILPPNYSTKKRYPVLFTVYGGPGSQQVSTAYYTDMFHKYLATKDYMIVCVDGRGTGFRGESFMKQIYKKMGIMEAADQIAAARYLVSKDRTYGNVAIWGWSYGGFVTASVMTNASVDGTFKLGMAVAPPTNWLYYDSAYTERFMATPTVNPSGYKETDVLHRASGIAPNSFLLVHGTADDNVHPMHSMLLNDKLVEANIPFTTMNYVNRDHSINVGNSRRHLYSLLSRTLANF